MQAEKRVTAANYGRMLLSVYSWDHEYPIAFTWRICSSFSPTDSSGIYEESRLHPRRSCIQQQPKQTQSQCLCLYAHTLTLCSHSNCIKCHTSRWKQNIARHCNTFTLIYTFVTLLLLFSIGFGQNTHAFTQSNHFIVNAHTHNTCKIQLLLYRKWRKEVKNKYKREREKERNCY